MDIEVLKREIERLNQIIALRDEEIRILNNKLFGRKSERKHFDATAKDQAYLFNEAEANVQQEVESPPLFSKNQKSHSSGRKPLPESLPRQIIDLKPADKKLICPRCNNIRSKIGEIVTEKVDIIPAKVIVKKYVRSKFICKCCESEPAEIIIEPLPKMLLPKSKADSGLMAYAITTKFADRIPFYHQSKMLSRIGVDIRHGDLCRWAIDAYRNHLVEPIKELRVRLFESNYLQIDETRLNVLARKGQQYMWIIHGKIENRTIALYHYQPSRSAEFLVEWSRNFNGVIQTDGWGSYQTHFAGLKNIVHGGCNVHSRRKFVDAEQSDITLHVIDEYAKIYHIESELEKVGAPPGEILRTRKAKILPIFESLKSYLQEKKIIVRPAGNTGGAIQYFLSEYERLIVFIKYPMVKPDTNLVENDARPFVVGRKNWLFSATDAGAEASAAFYTLVQISALNGWDPHQFLCRLFIAIESCTENINLVDFILNYVPVVD